MASYAYCCGQPPFFPLFRFLFIYLLSSLATHTISLRMDSECHSMVMEYLMHNCFKDTAKALLKETNKLEQCSKSSGKASKRKGIFFYM